jgi:predicted ATP-grasp superfamily ATP-dependent carboligase
MSGPVDARDPAPVLLLRSVAEPFPQHGVLGAVRSLGRWGVPVILAEPSAGRGVAAASRYLRSWEAWDPATGAEQILEIVARAGRPPVLLPTDDASVRTVEAHAEALRPHVAMASLPSGLADRLIDKEDLAALAMGDRLAPPRSARVGTAEELEEFVGDVGWPIVVKAGPGPRRPGRRSVAIVHDPAELGAMLTADGSLFLQEHVPGSPTEANWIVDAYLDGSSRCRFLATGRKLAGTPPYAGTACQAVVEPNDDLATAVTDLLERLGYVGPVDVDARWDARSGRYVLLDVNPRLGGTFRAFVGSRGLDVARCAYLDLTGRDIPDDRVPGGRMWILETHVLGSVLAYRRDGWLHLGTWARTLRHVREGGLLAMDDPWPVARAAGHAVRRSFRKLARRGRQGTTAGEVT